MNQVRLKSAVSKQGLTRIQRETLEVIDDGVGITVHDVSHSMDVPLWRCRLVVAELRRRGCVAFAGETSPELVITETGVAAYRQDDVKQPDENDTKNTQDTDADTMSWREIAGQIRRKLNLSTPTTFTSGATTKGDKAQENETD